MKKINILIIMIIILSMITYADETCEVIPIETFIDMNRTDIISYIDLQFWNLGINPTNLFVNYDMNTIVKRGDDYCLTRTDIVVSMPFNIIDFCYWHFPLSDCWDYLIMAEEPFTFNVSGVITDIEPINYQLIQEVNLEIDRIMEVQTQVYNENLISQLILQGNYTLPIIN